MLSLTWCATCRKASEHDTDQDDHEDGGRGDGLGVVVGALVLRAAGGRVGHRLQWGRPMEEVETMERLAKAMRDARARMG